MNRKLLAAMTATLILLAPAAAQAAFPGANGRIAFNWTFGCDGSVIATMQPDGSDLRRLTADPCVVDGPPRAAYPEYTADGSNLLFILGNRLATMTADGGAQTPLGVMSLNDPANPSVSPDGDRVAYTRTKRGHTTVYTANLDGTDERRLRRGSSPRFSPDGRTIAFLSGTGNITIARAATGKIIRRLDVGGSGLDWAPGGRRFVYETFDDMYVVRADGARKPRRLTRTVAHEISPVWSPDGKRIAFVRYLRSGEEELRFGVFTMRADGRGKAKRIFRTDEERVEETLEPLTISWQPVVGP